MKITQPQNLTPECEQKRQRLLEQFPHVVTVEGAYPEQDFLAQWCWKQFGPKQCEKCSDAGLDYPGCPLVLATEYIQTGWYEHKGQRIEWQEKAYKPVEEHGHSGKWTTLWLRKTGYDYGFEDYCFQNPEDRDEFVASFASVEDQFAKVVF